MKRLYSRFLNASPGRLHFAAHSHHPWPDVTRDAQVEAWDDAARLADHKWGRVFSEVMKEAQGHENALQERAENLCCQLRTKELYRRPCDA